MRITRLWALSLQQFFTAQHLRLKGEQEPPVSECSAERQEGTQVPLLPAEPGAAALARRVREKGSETGRHQRVPGDVLPSGWAAASQAPRLSHPSVQKNSVKETSQSVKHNNYIPSKASESGTCSTQTFSPCFLIIREDSGGFPIQRQSVSVESGGCRMPWLTFRRIIVSFTHGFSPRLPCTRLGSHRGFLFKNRCTSGAVCCGDVIDSGQQCP